MDGEKQMSSRKEAQKTILKELERVWNLYPDMRFGQLLINLQLADDSTWTWNATDEAIAEWLLKVGGFGQMRGEITSREDE